MDNLKMGEVYKLSFTFNELLEAEDFIKSDDIMITKVRNLETNTTLINDKEKFIKIIRQMRRGRFEITYFKKSC